MTNFTKGPWHVSDPNDHKNADIGISDGVFVLADMTNDIAENGYDQRANAALIAAAPELYEAMHELFQWAALRSDWLAAGKQEPPEHPISVARKILAKARGES